MKKRNTILGRMFDINCALNAIIKQCEMGEVSLTGFQGSSLRADPCLVDGLGLIVDTTYYHNGANALPTVGDTVFLDSAGLIPLDTSTLEPFDEEPTHQGTGILMSDSNALVTNSEGVSGEYTCR